MERNKLIKLVSIIVIIIALVIGFYKLFSIADESENNQNSDIKKTSTSTSKETWSTYEDAANGVSFEYPSSWEQQALEGGIVGFAMENGTNVTFTVEDLSENPVTLDEYTEAALENLDILDWEIEILESKNTTINGVPGYTLTYTATGEDFTKDGKNFQTKIKQAWAVKNNKAYIISFTGKLDNYAEESATGEKILQSLKIQ
ncbi:MAG: hypothetical protein A3B74_03565 [Candidatus Kerfeldbacteria bacterium RIFCSPHIGHO2_02_FULL_42_14]|uniref:PsbP C-terminal domain-containing protein n=1 Tax=Candidatus Kerfeldbacteria bacterium RIFCSPHIGHO2_02_FULL_42_14 TaxID=1798540 RepID=A0A1G2APW0_9BACT|nr:MAG: hypothetical protein A3B74_03565 [Candidatus Kerfeldbacteria bacterium RIFCSPHIGHO2_02_FULL_42_14]OGY80595.1 MAG: hypothetical protein A3E60_04060 [Candidatus Kerfeldbacteria bacterium RIFCSPHIGHO2_12_FULL_42_13]OGY82519.1 MAG: hypothetical protein A3I91_03725 [Candidatus Kerfeldbacteria bacterium RIFCSPLOWO2_02_FULL_42_19]OGY87559.1 MAG: hypothetical protein A3G01_00875 [Candidatus Kerfeldbacteria bacterium RIFCSPLOWO2_12_FULL_43_9]